MVTEKWKLDFIPHDQTFDGERCHATGYEVAFDGDDTTWYEYEAADGTLYYGR